MSYRYRHGMNWIRQEKRLAIYMRDHFACVYCRVTIEEEIILTLDHVRHYGGNESINLVTACMECNVLKGRRTVEKFVKELTGGDGDMILNRVKASMGIPIDGFLPYAKRVIANRKKKIEEPF